jgi:hypothetical protein
MINNLATNQRLWDEILDLISKNVDINLKGRNFKNITFTKEIQNEISFADCLLENCTFKGIDLYYVNFSNAIMKNVTIINCINIKFESINKLEINNTKRPKQNQKEIPPKSRPYTTKKRKKPNLISEDTLVGIPAILAALHDGKP